MPLFKYHRYFLSCIQSDCFPVLAAILGMYTLMSNKQYYDALGTTGTIANTEGINSTCDIISYDNFSFFFIGKDISESNIEGRKKMS